MHSRLSFLGVERETELHHRRRIKWLALLDALAINHRWVAMLIKNTCKLLVLANELNCIDSAFPSCASSGTSRSRAS